MFNLGGWEWAILLVIVLIVFGVGRLPEIGGAIGKSIREFREASKDEPKAEPTTVDKTTAEDVTKQEK
jgi:sec-independent protein translocase protein TatA